MDKGTSNDGRHQTEDYETVEPSREHGEDGLRTPESEQLDSVSDLAGGSDAPCSSDEAPADSGNRSASGSSNQDTQDASPSSEHQQDSPTTQSNSGESQPAASNSSRKKILIRCAIGLGIFACLVAAFVLLVHNWQDATCTEPQICPICGKTRGEPLGHDWDSATCTTAKTCARCGETEGSPLGHDWGEWTDVVQATCTSTGKKERTCARCGKVVSETTPMLEHTPGDWEEKDPSISSAGIITPGSRSRTCTVCGEVIDSEVISLSADEAEDMYKDACPALSYEEVARNPDTYEGTIGKFTGEVVQVLEDNGSYTLRVNVTPVSYGYTDTIMVVYTATEGDSRILEDDVITVYGQMDGLYTYESIMGASITVPLMFAEYVE